MPQSRRTKQQSRNSGRGESVELVRASVVRHLLEGEYSSPVRIVAFNTAEGWSRDVTEDIAAELAQACADRSETPPSIADFIGDHAQPSRVR
jgi:hypothetical protein